MTTRVNHDIILTYIVPVEKEEYVPIAIREGRPTGCKAAREGNARNVALEGADEWLGRQSARARPIQRTEAFAFFGGRK